MADYGIPRQLELFSFKDQLEPELSIPHFPRRESHLSVQETAPSKLVEMPSAQELTDLCRKLSNQLGLSKLALKVNVEWNSRMRTAAGRAHYRDARIELNPALLNLVGIDGPGEVDRTLRHELAHLVAHVRAKGRRIQPHGLEWHQACCDLGIPDESRCHTLPLQPRHVKRKHLYECPSCGSEVPRVRKFRRPVACYACCKKHSNGRYDARFRLQKVEDENVPSSEYAARAAAR